MDRKLISFLAKKPAAWASCIKVAGAMLMKRSEVIVNREGIRLTVRIGNGQGLFCALAGTEYEAEMRWFLAKMKEGDLFVDVGANVGVYTLHASRRVGAKGKVFAFEPTPETHQILVENTRLNNCSNVICEKIALGERNGTFRLVAGDRPASNSIIEATDAFDGRDHVIGMTLDSYCARHQIGKINFIKVDIEGGEAAFFKGASNTLRKDRPVVVFESLHTGPLYPEREILIHNGYKLYILNRGTMEEALLKTSSSGNVLAIPSEIVASERDFLARL